MEQTTNVSPAAATDEPAVLPTLIASNRPAARVSNRLSDALIAPALDAGGDVRQDRATRSDGWTPERIRAFLNALAECGVVDDAARAAGMSRQSAYRLRTRSAGRAFHVAWTAAEHLARRRLAEEVMSRAMHGCVEVIMRDGKVWGERHRFDNRLTMAVLTRLDRNVVAQDDENKTARLVAEEFDQYLDIVCAGGEGAAEFVADRVEADNWTPSREARTLERCGNYREHGVGLPEEVEALDRKSRRRKKSSSRPKARSGSAGMIESVVADADVVGDEEEKARSEIGHLAEDEPQRPELEGDEESADDGGDASRQEAPELEAEVPADAEAEADDPIAAAGARIVMEAAIALTARDPASDALTEPEPPALLSDAPAQGEPPAAPLAPPAEAPAEPAFEHHSGWVATD